MRRSVRMPRGAAALLLGTFLALALACAASSGPAHQATEPQRARPSGAPAPEAPRPDERGPMPRVPQAPGSLLDPGPFVRVDAFAADAAALRFEEGPRAPAFRLVEGGGVVLVLRGSFDHPRIIDEEQWESLAVALPSAAPGAYDVQDEEVDVVFDRSSGWVMGLHRTRSAEGVVEIIEVLEDGSLRVRFDLALHLVGEEQGGEERAAAKGGPRVRKLRDLPLLPLAEARRR